VETTESRALDGKGTGEKAKGTVPSGSPASGAPEPTAKTSVGRGSSKTEAHAAVAAFRKRVAATKGAGKFLLDPVELANRVGFLVDRPDRVTQGRLNVCGPAAFLRVWIPRDPLGFVNLALGLYEKGHGYLGKRRIEPGDDLRSQKWQPSWQCETADWMVTSSLRDDENWLLDFEGTPEEDVSAITTPGEVAEWLRESQVYRHVRDEGNLFMNKGAKHALGLTPDLATDVIVLINARILPDGFPKSWYDFVLNWFPSHYIVLLSWIRETSDRKLAFQYWTYGQTPPPAVIPAKTFDDGYFGAVIAQT